MSEHLKFKVSSALKDIIGKDLITDDFIAVFELVKNSYDAHATRVDITFEKINTLEARILIIDNGKGMDLEDLKNKWLFVAYSAKKDGTEDHDYRNKIGSKRAFAGAKGIGRFSCDRLGAKLEIETTKVGAISKTEVIITNWRDFEVDLKDEFVDVNLIHSSRSRSKYGLEHGTALEITEIRSNWDRIKYLRLKQALAKLINPSKSGNEQDFQIFLNVEDELDFDKSLSENHFKVNGRVENFIFEELDIRTTKILTSIDDDGETLTTTLYDGGTVLYKIKEKNEYKLLDSIQIRLYYLNQSAKNIFSRRMGLASVQFGHVFLYKNGFRVYPYGEEGEDPLKIDRRKAQGYNRYLGTRELIGQIEIESSSNEFKETSSRGDGLIQTPSYFELEDFFWMTLRRLEKYVVDVQQWGLSIEDELDSDLNERATALIAKLTDSKNILQVEYNENIIDSLTENQSNSAVQLVKNLKSIAGISNDNGLLETANLVEKRLSEITKQKDELYLEKSTVEKQKREVELKLEVKEKENELLRESSNDDIIELMAIEHHVNQASYRIDKQVDALVEMIRDFPDLRDSVIEIVNKISIENKKMNALVKFVRKANFDMLSSTVTQDIPQYIKEYVEKVYTTDRVKSINNQLIKNVKVVVNEGARLDKPFVPLELNIILDNLLDNSHKASATEVIIEISSDGDMLILDYSDNGIGVDPTIANDIFKFGVSTTKGSGIGLYHSKYLVEKMNGTIECLNVKNGSNFIIKIKK